MPTYTNREAAMKARLADRMFVDKVYTYVADPAFDGNVVQYLTTMVEEFKAQVRHYLAQPGDKAEALARATVAAGRRDAYIDALRVLDDAIDAAHRIATERDTP